MYGTGFLISPSLVLTCHHVLPDSHTAARSVLELDYYENEYGIFQQILATRFRPERVFATNETLDFTLVAVESVARAAIPLMPPSTAQISESITLLHHPQAGPLRVALRAGAITNVSDKFFQHTAETHPGSAGAPVLDEQLRLIGIHHAARHRRLAPIGEAIRSDEIIRHLAQTHLLELRELVPAGVSPINPGNQTVSASALESSADVATDILETREPQTRDSVFISYAHQDQIDQDWRQRLRVFLQPLGPRLDIWDDSRIRTGAEWRPEIDFAIRRAAIAVLLIGPHFLASEFIAENELPPLLDAAHAEKITILPLVTNECSYTRTPLAKYQSFNKPDQPLERMEKPEQNRCLRLFAEQIQDSIRSAGEPPHSM
jgi:hypothetical protein